MKRSTLQNRLVAVTAYAVMVVLTFFAFNVQTNDSSPFTTAEAGLFEQLEGVWAIGAEHVFDEEYWIANMHSIRSSQF